MKKILVVGSYNTDIVYGVDQFPKPGETIFTSRENMVNFGGKGFNQAHALWKLGADVTFACCVGDDGNSSAIIKFLKDNKIKNLTQVKSECSTGSAFIVVDGKGENQIIVSPGANNKIEINDALINEIKISDFVILQNEIPQCINEEIINIAFDNDTKIIYNPAPYRSFNRKILEKIFLLVPNETEYASIFNKNFYEKDCCNKNIIVTLGKNGAFIGKEINQTIPSFVVEAIDTVAAGDTFISCLSYSLALEKDLQDSVFFANAGAALSVTKKGASESAPTLTEVNDFLKR